MNENTKAAKIVANESRNTIIRRVAHYARTIAENDGYQGDIMEKCDIHFDDMFLATQGRYSAVKAESINLARYLILAADLLRDFGTFVKNREDYKI
ncbi:MAG: hypothetical protein GY941_23480 [Planctomycetes bacterium]|nr:hypothetical protein [Planctomycetota bacterium]